MYTDQNDKINSKEKLLFIRVYKKLKDEHTISWTRDTLIALNKENKSNIVECILKNIRRTDSFFELKVNLYLYRNLKNNWFVADAFVLQKSKSLNEFVTKQKQAYKLKSENDFWLQDHYRNFWYIESEFKNKDNLRFMEIGVFEGRTTTWLIDNVLKTGKNNKIYCIEPNLTENGKYNLDKVSEWIEFFPTYSEKILHTFERNVFDFIYDDGNHNARDTLLDMVLSWELLKEGGILLVDDYKMETYIVEDLRKYPTHIPPKAAIESFLVCYRGQYDLVINNYQIGLKKLV